MPASDGGSLGGSPPATHQGGPTGLQEVSDSVLLSQDVQQAYTGFDSTLHAVGADGRPLMKKGGGFQRKRGRKAGDQGSPAAPGTAQSAPAVNGVSTAPQMSSQEAAIFLVASTTAICHAVFGDEVWKVTDRDEFKGYTASVKAYLDATGGLNLSPGWGLVATGTAYAAPRLESDKTKTRLSKWRDFIVSKFSRK